MCPPFVPIDVYGDRNHYFPNANNNQQPPPGNRSIRQARLHQFLVIEALYIGTAEAGWPRRGQGMLEIDGMVNIKLLAYYRYRCVGLVSPMFANNRNPRRIETCLATVLLFHI